MERVRSWKEGVLRLLLNTTGEDLAAIIDFWCRTQVGLEAELPPAVGRAQEMIRHVFPGDNQHVSIKAVMLAASIEAAVRWLGMWDPTAFIELDMDFIILSRKHPHTCKHQDCGLCTMAGRRPL